MGDYAVDRKTGERFKIGTCDTMYYLRHDQKKDVIYEFAQGTRFRLIFKDELENDPGDFNQPRRYIEIRGANEFFSKEDIETIEPGINQLTNGYGLLANISCYHGLKLPEDSKGIHFFWNGYKEHFVLANIKELNDGTLTFIIECAVCGQAFRLDLEDIDKIKGFGEDFKLNVDYVKKHNEKILKERSEEK